jgi:hypothetical protein
MGRKGSPSPIPRIWPPGAPFQAVGEPLHDASGVRRVGHWRPCPDALSPADLDVR